MKMYMPGIDDFPQAPTGFKPGKYHMRYESSTQETAKDGRTYFKIRASIIEGPSVVDDAGNPIDYNGREFTIVIFMPDAKIQTVDWQLERSKRELRNFLEESGIPWDEEGFDPDDFTGAEAMVTLGPRKNNPEMMEVKRFDAV